MLNEQVNLRHLFRRARGWKMGAKENVTENYFSELDHLGCSI